MGKTEDLTALSLKAARDPADRMAIRKVLARTQNNLSTAAKILGVSRPTLYDLMRAHNLEVS